MVHAISTSAARGLDAVEALTRNASEVACHKCRGHNVTDARFCATCGSALFESCRSCGNLARIGQPFCGDCGFHLLAAFEQRLKSGQDSLARARAAMEKLAFDEADELLRQVHHLEKDERLAELKQSADTVRAELRRLQDQWCAKVESITVAASEAERALEHAAVLRILKAVPAQLMNGTLRQMQSRAEALIQEEQELRSSLRRAIKAKDYLRIGADVETLLSLAPDDQELISLAGQISSVLIKAASVACRAGRFADAFEQLVAVPRLHQDSPQYQKLKAAVDDAVWITDQIARSPDATPTLGTLARRLAGMAPDNERAGKVVRELAGRIRSGSTDPLSLYPPWAGATSGWEGAPVSIAGPTWRIRWGEQKELSQHPTRLAVAIGLALHGLGESCMEGYRCGTRGASDLLSRLRGKANAQTAWGIDAGTSAVRAVRLEREGSQIRIAEVVWLPLDSFSGRAGKSLSHDQHPGAADPPELLARLGELALRIGRGGTPTWANLPARDVLARFLALPPLPEKKLTRLLAQETATQFPLPIDQLATASNVTRPAADESARAVLLASKKATVQQREKLFSDAGLKISGFQVEPIALHNFAAYEWAELIAAPADSQAEQPAIVVLDGGASGTTCCVATAAGYWFRHFSFGGQDLTSKLASVCNLTHQQAEAMRMQPANLVPLASGMQALERRIEDFSFQLSQSLPLARQSLGEFKLSRILCTGGAVLQHGWTRHAISAPSA